MLSNSIDRCIQGRRRISNALILTRQGCPDKTHSPAKSITTHSGVARDAMAKISAAKQRNPPMTTNLSILLGILGTQEQGSHQIYQCSSTITERPRVICPANAHRGSAGIQAFSDRPSFWVPKWTSQESKKVIRLKREAWGKTLLETSFSGKYRAATHCACQSQTRKF